MQRLKWTLGLKNQKKLGDLDNCFKDSSKTQTSTNNQGQQLQPVVASLQGQKEYEGYCDQYLWTRVRSPLRWHTFMASKWGPTESQRTAPERDVYILVLPALWVSPLERNYLGKQYKALVAWGQDKMKQSILPDARGVEVGKLQNPHSSRLKY